MIELHHFIILLLCIRRDIENAGDTISLQGNKCVRWFVFLSPRSWSCCFFLYCTTHKKPPRYLARCTVKPPEHQTSEEFICSEGFSALWWHVGRVASKNNKTARTRRSRRRRNKYKRKPFGDDVLALILEHSSKNTQIQSTVGLLVKKKKYTVFPEKGRS